MNSAFGEVFLFLTNLAWKSRITIPALVTTVFLIMDIRLQIEINIQSGQVAAADLEQLDDSEDEDTDDDDLDEDYSTESSNEDEHANSNHVNGSNRENNTTNDADDYESTANRLRRSLGLS